MYRSQLLLTTRKETPAEAEIVSHQLMLRAGLIHKLSSGLYTWLPLGLRVLQKIERVVRQEMNAIGCQEIMMPCVQPAELWHQTKRWEAYGNELLKIQDRHQREFCYAPTAEEVVTKTLQQLLSSYKQLPVTVYQITNKFRDEIRPRFGILRAREFIMKDAYSFHLSNDSLNETYQRMFKAYHRILDNLGLAFRAVSADGGNIGEGTSHEFQILADIGEDEILYNDAGTYAANVEIAAKAGLKAGDISPDGQGQLKSTRGIEVGHIFQLGDKYTAALNAAITDENGNRINMLMGCYGFGVSRVVAAAIEQHHDNKGIIWPSAIAPFAVIIIPIGFHQSAKVKKATERLYHQLQDSGIEVLLDDRQERPGMMFNEAELIGIPHRLVISDRGLSDKTVEYKSRKCDNSEHIDISDIEKIIRYID
ncbi:MAG: proline--tRNA ligase [Pseudomonadota bacterium]